MVKWLKKLFGLKEKEVIETPVEEVEV